jgi:hypothetical protein
VKKKLMVIVSFAVVTILIVATLWYVLIENKTYEVSFNSNGGSLVETQKIKNKNQATKPTDPTKAKHNFIGWYLNDIEYDFLTPITENIELNAKWILKDLVMECNNEHDEIGMPGITKLKGQIIVKFDPVDETVKDAGGYVEITFANSNDSEKMKSEVKKAFCTGNIKESKCVITVNGNLLRLEVQNEKNIVDVTKTIEEIKKDLEAQDGGEFICKLKEE